MVRRASSLLRVLIVVVVVVVVVVADVVVVGGEVSLLSIAMIVRHIAFRCPPLNVNATALVVSSIIYKLFYFLILSLKLLCEVVFFFVS